MNTAADIKLSHSECRPKTEAWCAASDGIKVYAPTREEALEKHRSTAKIYALIDKSIKACAAAI